MRLEIIHTDPLQTGGHRRLILIFAGWGSDPALYQDIRIEGWDTAVVWDYRDLSLDIERLHPYSTIYLYAWSMGVWAASAVGHLLDIDCAFAINGTGTPRHDFTGIPTAVYDGTLDTLDERNLKKFRLRMAGDRETASRLDSILPTPDIDGLKEELAYIREAGPALGMKWNRAYISESDRIFPADSQRRFWTDTSPADIVILPGAHYTDFPSIVRSTVFNLEKVGRRFGKALPTYDSHAHAQREIALHLADRIKRMNPPRNGRALEIGSGSGLFTRIYAPLLTPHSVSFLDLYPMPEYGIAPEEYYHIGDAEKWLGTAAETEIFDIILSASAIQWFSSPRNFFRNAARLLGDGGVLAVSSFTKGNLSELDVLRLSPIVYRTAGELRELAEEYFDNVEVEEKEFRLSFTSPREVLLHLKHTGVGGSSSTGSGAATLMRRLRREADGSVTLTYRAVFITGVKLH